MSRRKRLRDVAKSSAQPISHCSAVSGPSTSGPRPSYFQWSYSWSPFHNWPRILPLVRSKFIVNGSNPLIFFPSIRRIFIQGWVIFCYHRDFYHQLRVAIQSRYLGWSFVIISLIRLDIVILHDDTVFGMVVSFDHQYGLISNCAISCSYLPMVSSVRIRRLLSMWDVRAIFGWNIISLPFVLPGGPSCWQNLSWIVVAVAWVVLTNFSVSGDSHPISLYWHPRFQFKAPVYPSPRHYLHSLLPFSHVQLHCYAIYYASYHPHHISIESLFYQSL